MRLLIYEEICASGTRDVSLRREGEAMLRALLEDACALPHCRVSTVLPSRLDVAGIPPQCRVFAQPDELRRLAVAHDYTLIVAPEIDGVLARRCREADCEGLLNAPAEVIELCADKLALYRHFVNRGVPTPETFPAADSGRRALHGSGPIVVKPRFGAGSWNVRLIDRGENLLRMVEQGDPATEYVVQPFLDGMAASVAFIFGKGRWQVLPALEQLLSDDGRFRYLGGRGPLPTPLLLRATALAEKAVASVDGLQGFVGVDLILAGEPTRDAVIEINPRVTTSYVGLRQLTPDNLLEAALRLADGHRPKLQWLDKEVVFRVDH